MKKLLVIAVALLSTIMLHAQSKVYMTKEISPEALVRIYKALIERINRQHGTYITEYAEKIGLGSKKYEIEMIK